MRRFLAFIGATFVATTLGAFISLPVSAHGALVSGNPGPGAQVGKGIVVIGLTFEELKDKAPAKVSVNGPVNNSLSVGKPVAVTNRSICFTVEPLVDVGVYAVAYEVTVQDGHLETGRYLFEVSDSVARPAEPAECMGIDLPAPTISNQVGSSPLIIVAVAGAIAALISLVVIGGRRKAFTNKV